MATPMYCGGARARFEQTAKLMTKQIAVYKRADQKAAMFRLMLSQIVVQLANDDGVGANIRYQDYLQYGAGAVPCARHRPAGA